MKLIRIISVKYVNFHLILLFLNVSKKAHISKRKRRFNVKSSAYNFHVKTEILADFQICIISGIIWEFFSNDDFPSGICCDFSRTSFRRIYFYLLLPSNYFDKTVTFSEQLFLQSVCFFRWSSFFRIDTSLQQLFFSE